MKRGLMKEVVFIIPNLGGGGAERVMAIVANYLAELNYKVSFLFTKSVDIKYEINSNIKVIVNKEDTSPIGQIKFIRHNLKSKKGATCISFLTYQNLYMLTATIGLKIKTIVSERNDPSKTLYGKNWLNSIRNILYVHADRIVFQTNGAKMFFPKKIQKKGTIILNPINDKLPVPEDLKREKEIVAVGRLTKQKNYPLLLKAFSKFSIEYPEYVLKIYGEGELKEELKNLATKLKIEKKVYFMGFCEDVHNKIINARMFVMSSEYEGLSNALLEAMAIGLPCISTDSPPGGARMVIKNGVNGILVENNNEKELVDALNILAKDDELVDKLAENAICIRKELSKDKICEEWTFLV